MNEQQKMLDLEDERRREKQYKEVLAERAKAVSTVAGPASGLWTGTGQPQKPVYGDAFVGRVFLMKADELFGSEFYIGETHATVDGIDVFGWTNPIACTFFQGKDHHELCVDVGAIRVFRHDNKGQLAHFIDEALRPDAPSDPFSSKSSGPSIQLPSVLPELPTLSGSPVSSEHVDELEDPKELPIDELSPVRAEALLREQMLAPRGSSLGSVLSTLQPDQYELVVLPAMDNVIIEGQPGTGKTIVASHRAAYLVNDDTPPENSLDGRVLVVGPTDGYSNHVRQVINRLAGDTDRVRVLSLPELADEIIDERTRPPAAPAGDYPYLPWQLARVARSAIRRLNAVADRNPLPRQAYQYLRIDEDVATLHPEWAPYLRQLPPYEEALQSRGLAPLIAFIHWEIDKPESLKFVEHVIVDEAQDVTPLEWLLLDEINEADAWTILGDLNQRRSDHTLETWREVLDVIAIETDTPVRRMKRGYRSTGPILEYANQLLPRAERRVFAFQQDGPEPTVRKVRQSDLGAIAVEELERLLAAYPAGTVAAICQNPDVIISVLRKQGWTSEAKSRAVWTKGEKAIKVLVPNAARGLEFDAVVVVEPAEFPTRYGRLGTLYTALTRANRELAVVHATPLPRSLKRI